MRAPSSRTFGELLIEQAARWADRPAVICGERVASYAQLSERARKVAAGLQARGIGRGDRVGLLMNNRLEWIESFFGASLLGAAVAAFSTWSTREELDYLIADAGIKLLVTLDGFSGHDFVATLRALAPEAEAGEGWRSARHPALRGIVVLGRFDAAGMRPYAEFDALRPLDGAPAPGDGPSAVDDAVIIYTSGSSSRPKSVPLAHYGMIENGFNIGERQGYGPDDRVLLAPPLFWSYGNANAMAATLTHGAALVLQGKFDAGEALELIERHRCTALYTLPAITSALLSHPAFRPERTRSLRTGLTIGAPQDVIAAAEVLGASEICNVYGQTESYGNCCVTSRDWPLERRANCQGLPLPGVSLRIMDPESGEASSPGKPGLIEVRGYVTRGYLGASAGNNEEALTRDGFLRTGDMGMLTEAGELRYLGRTTEMIKKGGINVSPAEVEDVLMRHPAVALAGAVGVPDPVEGELLAAFVVAKPGASLTAAELTRHCRGLVSRYKVPDVIELRDALPVTPTGKLMRRELKRLAADLGGDT